MLFRFMVWLVINAFFLPAALAVNAPPVYSNDPTHNGSVSSSSSNSRDLGDIDPLNMAVDRGLSWGAGFANSLGEEALSDLVDGGRARFNFRLDRDGYFNGEGDALLPFYDGKFTTVYTQLGARSMHDSDNTRWIGNFGLGQRWFPMAVGENIKSADYDTGSVMFGYNAFFDYDFTRNHQRGGLGVEAQFDWLRLASNYYFPLSDWKDSKDFDSRFVQERPAEGWDVRAKGYLPFYRNVAVTSAYSQWYGDHVGMFGASRQEKDPKVWSYGIEYTPVPLVSGFITQKSTERGRSDTEFGLTFTYHFQMPWEHQISHNKVEELRTVGGSRHEFVDRENQIILEYRAKNSYRIEFVGQDGSNTFRFRIRDGFDKLKAGQTVRVTAGGVTLAAASAEAGLERSLLASTGSAIVGLFSVKTARAADFSQSYTSDRRGEFVVRVSSPTFGPVVLQIQAGDNTQSFTVNVADSGYELEASPNILIQGTPVSVTLTLKKDGQPVPPNTSVTFNSNANFTELASSVTKTTNNAGRITLLLTAITAGNQTISATVDGQTVSVALRVNSGTYTLEAAPNSLDLHTPINVTFTFKQGDQTVPANTPVIFSANPSFMQLSGPVSRSTNAAGRITMGLTAVTPGSQTILATVNNQPVSVTISVFAGAYTMEASPASMAQGLSTSVIFTVKLGGLPVSSNIPVVFGSNTNFTELSSSVTRNTDSTGQITLNLTGTTTGSHTISGTVGSQPVEVAINVTPP